jgi:hypothetical protein
VDTVSAHIKSCFNSIFSQIVLLPKTIFKLKFWNFQILFLRRRVSIELHAGARRGRGRTDVILKTFQRRMNAAKKSVFGEKIGTQKQPIKLLPYSSSLRLEQDEEKSRDPVADIRPSKTNTQNRCFLVQFATWKQNFTRPEVGRKSKFIEFCVTHRSQSHKSHKSQESESESQESESESINMLICQEFSRQ